MARKRYKDQILLNILQVCWEGASKTQIVYKKWSEFSHNHSISRACYPKWTSCADRWRDIALQDDGQRRNCAVAPARTGEDDMGGCGAGLCCWMIRTELHNLLRQQSRPSFCRSGHANHTCGSFSKVIRRSCDINNSGQYPRHAT
jgi:hypothetical protein